MPALATLQEVQAEFSDVTDNALLERCLRLCTSYQLSASQLLTQWELLVMNNSSKGIRSLTLDTLSELETRVKEVDSNKRRKMGDDSRSSSVRAQLGARPTPPTTLNKDSAAQLLGGLLGGSTPKRPRAPLGSSSASSFVSPAMRTGETASPASSFATRVDKGKVLSRLNPELGFAPVAGETKVNLETKGPTLGSYMWEKLETRARLMDAQVEALEQQIAPLCRASEAPAGSGALEPAAAAAQIGAAAAPAAASKEEDPGAKGESAVDDLLPPLAGTTASSPDEMTIVGRICCEAEGKLNAKSVFLEGTRARSNACRVRLDLSECPEYALFPGQTVAVCGINSAGHTLIANRIVPGMLPPVAAPAPAVPKLELAAGGALSVLVATGPFTCSEELSYAPLDELLAVASKRSVGAVVLLGPFVDETHSGLSAAADSLFEDVFERCVLAKIKAFLDERIGMDEAAAPHVLLMPSLRDVHHAPIFPQPPFAAAVPARVRAHLHLLPNPAAVTLNGVTIAGCSLDALMALSQQELASSVPPGVQRPDRMSRLATHLLKQRLFMPLLPAPHDERNPLPVDIVASLQDATLVRRPDILLVPSDLAPFAKVVEGGVLCLNSGRLTRKQTGGNYALLTVHPDSKAEAAAGAEAAADGTSVAARTFVEIVRI